MGLRREGSFTLGPILSLLPSVKTDTPKPVILLNRSLGGSRRASTPSPVTVPVLPGAPQAPLARCRPAWHEASDR